MDIPLTQNLLDFNNKVVIVTGAGSGIGKRIATRFAEAGASVVVHYRSSETGAQDVVKNIHGMGREAIAIEADINQRRDIEYLCNKSIDNFGKIDILINNAGTYPLKTLIEMTDDEWELVLNTNLRSIYICTQIVVRQIIKQGTGGSIVNLASIEGENPASMHSHYVAAKGGVIMYTRAAALELGSYNIRVNAVSPGLIWHEGLDKVWPEGVNRYLKKVPLNRLGQPDDVADACLFLASPAARWITGVNLRVDGGMITSPGY